MAPALLRDKVVLGVKLTKSVLDENETPITFEDVVRLTFLAGNVACCIVTLGT